MNVVRQVKQFQSFSSNVHYVKQNREASLETRVLLARVIKQWCL